MTKLEKTKSGYYAANQGFATTFEGEPLFVKEGELVHKDHPLLKGREELFEPAEQLTRFDRPEIEQATAAPGEKRGNGRRRRRMSETETEPEAEPATEPEAEPEAEPAEGDDDEEKSE
jgi:hypothetical protein